MVSTRDGTRGAHGMFVGTITPLVSRETIIIVQEIENAKESGNESGNVTGSGTEIGSGTETEIVTVTVTVIRTVIVIVTVKSCHHIM